MSRKSHPHKLHAPRASLGSCLAALIALNVYASLANAQSWEFSTRGKTSAIAVYELAKGGRVAFECPSRTGGGGPSLSITRDLVVDLGARWRGYATVSDLIIGPEIKGASIVPKGSRGAAAFVPIPATGWVTHDFFGADFDEILGDVAATTLTLRVRGREDVVIPLSGLLQYIGQLRDACSRTSHNRFVLPVRRWLDADDVPDRLRLDRSFLGSHVGFFAKATYGDPHAMTPVFERLAGSDCAGLVVATDLFYTENWGIGRQEERVGLGFRPSSNFKQGVMKGDCTRGGRAIIVGRWNDDDNSRVFFYRGHQLSFQKVEAMLRKADTWSGDFPELAAALARMAQEDDVPTATKAQSPAFDDITDSRAGIGWNFDGKIATAPLRTRSGRSPFRGIANLPEACLSAPGLTEVGGMGTVDLDQVDTSLELVGRAGFATVTIKCGKESATLPIVTEVRTGEGNSWQILDTPNNAYIQSIIKKRLVTAFYSDIEEGSTRIEESDDGHIRIVFNAESDADDAKNSDAYKIGYTTFGARPRLIVRVSADSDRVQNLLIDAFRRAGLRVPFDPGQHAEVQDWPIYIILNNIDRVYFRNDAYQVARHFFRIRMLDLMVRQTKLDNQLAALGELRRLINRHESKGGDAVLDDVDMPEYALRVHAARILP